MSVLFFRCLSALPTFSIRNILCIQGEGQKCKMQKLQKKFYGGNRVAHELKGFFFKTEASPILLCWVQLETPSNNLQDSSH